MTLSDPIADMLSRLGNAARASHDAVLIPSSKEKLAIARILKREGYIEDYETVTPDGGHEGIRINLRYGRDQKKSISGLRRISKPGRRVYAKAGNLPKVLGGMGTAILSTSAGMMTDREARRRKVGGEVIAYIW